jgi:hypothetical protein
VKKRSLVAFPVAAALVLGAVAVPSPVLAGGPPPTIPGKSSPAPKPPAKKSCPWYKVWC